MPVFDCVSGDVVRSVFVVTYGGQTATMSRDWQLSSVVGAPTIKSTAILEALVTDIPEVMKLMMCNDAHYYGTMLYKRTPVGPAPRPDHTTIGSGPGTAGINALPTQACGLISLYTATLGKTGQGRIYLPFPSTASSDVTGTPTGTYINNLVLMGDSLIRQYTAVDGVTTTTFRGCLYIPGGTPPRYFNAYTIHDAWATQRKRGAFGKVNKPPF